MLCSFGSMALVFPNTRSRWWKQRRKDETNSLVCSTRLQTDESNEMVPIRLSMGKTLANRLTISHCHKIEFPPFEAISFAKKDIFNILT